MSKWFCKTETGLSVAEKLAVFEAGYLVKKNNAKLVERILPVAQGIEEKISSGGDNDALNAILAEAIGELVGQTSSDPITQAAISAVLTQTGIDVSAGSALKIDNQKIKDLVGSFVSGLSAAVAG